MGAFRPLGPRPGGKLAAAALRSAALRGCVPRPSSAWRQGVGPEGTRPLAALARDQEGGAFQGVYGPWRVEAEDVREVTAYRAGISVATAGLLAAAASAFVPDEGDLHAGLVGLLDPSVLVGCGGLGLSLVLVHIYVAPLKRFLQALYAAGTVGTLAIMATQDEPAAQYVLHHPIAVWAVGPLFAAATGLSFKVCLSGWTSTSLRLGTICR